MINQVFIFLRTSDICDLLYIHLYSPSSMGTAAMITSSKLFKYHLSPTFFLFTLSTQDIFISLQRDEKILVLKRKIFIVLILITFLSNIQSDELQSQFPEK